MQQVTSTVDIAAPPEAAWDVLCDPHVYAELVEVTERMVDVPDAPMAEGYRYKEYGGLGPFKGESEWVVTAFEPKRRQVHEGDDGTMAIHLTIDLEPTADGCRMHQEVRLEPRGAMGILSKALWPLFMRRMAQKAMDDTLENFKRKIEAGTGA